MAKERYLKYRLPLSTIYEILTKQNKNKIIFFIDLQSICKGLYKRDNIFYEISYFMENRKISLCLIEELRIFLNKLYKGFQTYSPFFVIFYDDGFNSQNKLVQSGYKTGRSSIRDIIMDNDEHLALYYQIKSMYFAEIEQHFTREGVGKVYYLKEYESDLIPYFCIDKNLWDSQESHTLNVILSTDKDLLQCCRFNNTIQITNRFLPSKISNNKQFAIDIYDNCNAINYIYDKFKPGLLDARFIPLILALAGDSADSINGLPGIGKKKALDLIQNFSLPDELSELIKVKEKLPPIMLHNFDRVVQNMKLIDFREQLRRTSSLKS